MHYITNVINPKKAGQQTSGQIASISIIRNIYTQAFMGMKNRPFVSKALLPVNRVEEQAVKNMTHSDMLLGIN